MQKILGAGLIACLSLGLAPSATIAWAQPANPAKVKRPTIEEFRRQSVGLEGKVARHATQPPGPITAGMSPGSKQFRLPDGSIATFVRCDAEQRCQSVIFHRVLGKGGEPELAKAAAVIQPISERKFHSMAQVEFSLGPGPGEYSVFRVEQFDDTLGMLDQFRGSYYGWVSLLAEAGVYDQK